MCIYVRLQAHYAHSDGKGTAFSLNIHYTLAIFFLKKYIFIDSGHFFEQNHPKKPSLAPSDSNITDNTLRPLQQSRTAPLFQVCCLPYFTRYFFPSRMKYPEAGFSESLLPRRSQMGWSVSCSFSSGRSSRPEGSMGRIVPKLFQGDDTR